MPPLRDWTVVRTFCGRERYMAERYALQRTGRYTPRAVPDLVVRAAV